MNKLTKLILATAILATSGFAITVESGGTAEIYDSYQTSSQLSMRSGSKLTVYANSCFDNSVNLHPGSELELVDEVAWVNEGELQIYYDKLGQCVNKLGGGIIIQEKRPDVRTVVYENVEMTLTRVKVKQNYIYVCGDSDDISKETLIRAEDGTPYVLVDNEGNSYTKLGDLINEIEILYLKGELCVKDAIVTWLSSGYYLENSNENLSGSELENMRPMKLRYVVDNGFIPDITKDLGFIHKRNGDVTVALGDYTDTIKDEESLREYLEDYGMNLKSGYTNVAFSGGLAVSESLGKSEVGDAVFVGVESINLDKSCEVLGSLHNLGSEIYPTFSGTGTLTLKGNNKLLSQAVFDCETILNSENSVPKISTFKKKVAVSSYITLGEGDVFVSESDCRVSAILTVGAGAKIVLGKKTES